MFAFCKVSADFDNNFVEKYICMQKNAKKELSVFW